MDKDLLTYLYLEDKKWAWEKFFRSVKKMGKLELDQLK
jgi:hypothetical protein